jgi:hypothetical protein
MAAAPPGAHVSARVRLCLKDLFHQDVVEMVERETRKYQIWEVTTPEDPDFPRAYALLWQAFGPQGEMEREEAIQSFLRDDPYEPTRDGTYILYFLLVAKDADGNLRGVRDGSVLVNPAYAADLCVVYLSHIYMLPEARGTVLSYWLRIAPVELAVRFCAELHRRGKIVLPQPDQPGKHFGMRVDLAAEMEYFAPEDHISWQRILFYGRGGFDAINPRHFPYRQPDFRDPEEIRQTGNRPMPFMVLVRRMGRERQATLPIDEARALMNLLYDDFESHCAPEFLANSLDLVLDRLEERARRKDFVELLPLPTGPRDLHRLKKLWRYHVYSRYYPNDAFTREYLDGGMKATLAREPRWLEHQLARIAAELETRPAFVYGNRDKDLTWEGLPIPKRGDMHPEPSPGPPEAAQSASEALAEGRVGG